MCRHYCGYTLCKLHFRIYNYQEVGQVKHDCIHILHAVAVNHVIDYSQIYYSINYTYHHTRFLAVSLTWNWVIRMFYYISAMTPLQNDGSDNPRFLPGHPAVARHPGDTGDNDSLSFVPVSGVIVRCDIAHHIVEKHLDVCLCLRCTGRRLWLSPAVMI